MLLSDLAQVCSLSTWECPTGEPPFPSKLKRLSLYLATKQAQDATESEASISEGGIGDVVQGIARVLEQARRGGWRGVRRAGDRERDGEATRATIRAVVLRPDLLSYRCRSG